MDNIHCQEHFISMHFSYCPLERSQSLYLIIKSLSNDRRKLLGYFYQTDNVELSSKTAIYQPIHQTSMLHSACLALV